MLGQNCSSTCATRDHATFGACLKAKGFRIGWANSAAGKDYSTQKRWDSRLQEYRQARSEGIRPESTKLGDIRHAVDESNRTGIAYEGTNLGRSKG